MEELKQIIETHIKKFLPPEYADAKVIFQKTQKNNGIMLDCFSIKRPGDSVAANIYLDDLDKKFQQGRAPGKILKEIAQQVLSVDNLEIDTGFWKDYNLAQDKIVFRLVNKEKNQGLIDEIPSRDYQNLLITYRYVADINDEKIGTSLITNEMVESWGVDESTLYNKALENTVKLFPEQIESLDHMIRSLLEETGINEMDGPVENTGMYVITNQMKINGATVILYPGIQEKIAELFHGNYFILPSSTHEILAVAADQSKSSELKEIVMSVNRSTLSPDEFLSDNVYYYDGNKLEMVSEMEQEKENEVNDTIEDFMNIEFPEEMEP